MKNQQYKGISTANGDKCKIQEIGNLTNNNIDTFVKKSNNYTRQTKSFFINSETLTTKFFNENEKFQPSNTIPE